MNLFAQAEQARLNAAAPLAVRMRPTSLDTYLGQQHIIGPGKLLWRMLHADRLSSLIFYGPPGTGKTALAHVIANHSQADFIPANATAIGVARIREIIDQARHRLANDQTRTVLFLDEIHRFTRAQQDVLLESVEHGIVILVGATTENPFFSVNSALISRSTIFEFHPLTTEDIKAIIRQALGDKQRGLGHLSVTIQPEALDYLAQMSDGDARRALTALEIGVLSQARQLTTRPGTSGTDSRQPPSAPNTPEHPTTTDTASDTDIDTGIDTAPDTDKDAIVFDKPLAEDSIQRKAILSDPAGDSHYDLASAFQKSMRGSDPDATIYWLARMIVGGEDPRFIARRIAVTAAEDVGNADPTATILAAACLQISELVGLPEAQLHLAQAALYVACSPKSNRPAKAIWSASADVRNGRTIPVPNHLRDAHYKGAAQLDRGTDYQYPHDYPDGFIPQSYLPQPPESPYYQPTRRGRELRFAEYLDKLEKIKKDIAQQPPKR